MAIVPLVKIVLLGETYRKRVILSNLQQLGFFHLLPHEKKDVSSSSFRTTKAYEAYLYLKGAPQKRRQIQSETRFDYEKYIQQVLTVRDQALALEEEKSLLHRRISALEPWGDFDYRDLKDCGNQRLWFYIIPLSDMKELEHSQLIWECVFSDNRFAYVTVISPEEPSNMPAPRTHTGSKSLSWLYERLEEVEEELEDLHWQRIEHTGNLTQLAKHLAYAADQAELDHAVLTTYSDSKLFALEAWAPEASVEEIKEFADAQGLLLEAHHLVPEERPPTLLNNTGHWVAGQQLVSFYTTPGYTLWDPSKLVFSFFILFFSMIVADAGYGLVLFLTAVSLRKQLRRSSEPIYRLMQLLALGTIVYGALCGSYFGLQPSSGSVLEPFHILNLQNQDLMMKISIILGVVHLCIALVANITFSRNRRFPLQSGGWIFLLNGGLLLWLGPTFFSKNVASQIGWVIIGIGVFLIIFYSSNRPWRKATLKDRLLRVGEGLFALTGISKIFGDVLSYLRLFALGLASAQLAITFNMLAHDSMTSNSGVGTLSAILILCLGHGLNLLLALMSGVVHGLRLNFIEFFNWGLAEEGTPFKPFAKRRINLWNQL